MKHPSKLLEKHHQMLKGLNKESQPETQTKAQAPVQPVASNQNPFARQSQQSNPQSSQTSSMITSNQNPQTPVSQRDISQLQAYNSNPDCIRLTTDVFPQVSAANSIVFPLGAFIKPLGLSVA